MSNIEKDKDKKFRQKFKNIFSPKILSATWEKEGMEVSSRKNNFSNIYNKDNFQKRQIFIKKRRERNVKISYSQRNT